MPFTELFFKTLIQGYDIDFLGGGITVREEYLSAASRMCPDQGLDPQPRYVT